VPSDIGTAKQTGVMARGFKVFEFVDFVSPTQRKNSASLTDRLNPRRRDYPTFSPAQRQRRSHIQAEPVSYRPISRFLTRLLSLFRVRTTMRQTILVPLLLAFTTVPLLAQTAVQARRAMDFVYSMGVNVHLEYLGSPYQHYAAINSRLIELGMHHVRDEINDTANGRFVAELQQMKTMGYTVCGLIEGGNDYPPAGEVLEAQKVVPMIQNLLPSIDAVEGPNEPDDSTMPPFAYGLDYLLYPQGAINESENLWEIVKGDPAISGLPVLAMSEGTPQDFLKLAAVTPPPIYYANLGNMHAYQSGLWADWGLIHMYIPLARKLTGSLPLWTTEMGYHNNPNFLSDGEQQGVSERASAIYLPIAFLSGFIYGVQRTFSYELIDEEPGPPLASCTPQDQARCMGEGYYGLLHYDGTPKPSFTALKNLIGILQEGNLELSAVADPGSLSVTFSGAPPKMGYTLLEKSNGDYYFALFNNLKVYELATATSAGYDIDRQPVPVTITFYDPYKFTVYAPNDPSGITPTSAYTISTTPNSIQLNLPAKVLLLKIAASR